METGYAAETAHLLSGVFQSEYALHAEHMGERLGCVEVSVDEAAIVVVWKTGIKRRLHGSTIH